MTSNVVQEIKDRIRLSDIISKKVKLVKKGREYNGLCPFHNDSSPSLWVNDEKGTYHCFSCHAGGDIFAFIMNSENLAYFEVLKKLSSQIGIKLPEKNVSDNKNNRLYEVLNLACEFYENNLANNRTAVNYFNKRNINQEIIAKFKLGYAPNNNQLTKYLLSKKYEMEDIIEAGLAVKSQYGSAYDRFQNRVIFPIFDTRNRVIAFGGRVLDDTKPKYLNSPETPLFNKSTVLFAEDKLIARKNSGNIIIVEGYVDVISLYKAGIENAVAPLGTSLTQDHLKKIWRFDSRPILCFDGDESGLKAACRIVNLMLPIISAEFNIEFCLLPNNLDPDDVINESGKDGFLEILGNKKSIIELVWHESLQSYPLNTPENRALFEKDLERKIGLIQDKKLASNYLRYLKNKLWEFSKNKFPIQMQNNLNTKNLTRTQKIELDMLVIIITNPEIINDQEISLELHNLDFENHETENILINLLKMIDLFAINNKLDVTLKEYIQRNIVENNSFINEYIKQNDNLVKKISILNNSSNLKKLWFLSYYQYLLIRIEIEREKALQEMTKKSLEKADYLFKQILEIKYKIKEIQEEINNIII